MSTQKNTDTEGESNVEGTAHQNPPEDGNDNADESTAKVATVAPAGPPLEISKRSEQEMKVEGGNDGQGPVLQTPSLSDDGNGEANVSPISSVKTSQADPGSQLPTPNEQQMKAFEESSSQEVAPQIEGHQDNGKQKAAESSTKDLNEAQTVSPLVSPITHGQEKIKIEVERQGTGTVPDIENHGKYGSATECAGSSVDRAKAKLPKISTGLPQEHHAHTQGESSALGAARQSDLVYGKDSGEPLSEANLTNNNASKEEGSANLKSPKLDRQATTKRQSRQSSLGLVYQSYHEYGNERADSSTPRPVRRSRVEETPRGPARRDRRERDEIELSSTRAVRGAPVNPPLISRIPDQPRGNKKSATAHGPPYQSYQEYDDTKHGASRPQQANTEDDTGPSFAEGYSWVYLKVGLHLLAIAVSICTLGLSFSLIDNKDQRGEIVAISSPVPAVALVWSVIELVARYTSKTKNTKSGIHPAGRIAGCLVIWFASVVTIVFEWIYIQDIFDFCETSPAVKRKYSDQDYWEYKCEEKWVTQKVLLITMTALATITWLLYFMLFVIAFIDNARRTQRKQGV